jgi:hypothetical protein
MRTGSQKSGVRGLRRSLKVCTESDHLGGPRLVAQAREARYGESSDDAKQTYHHDCFDQGETCVNTTASHPKTIGSGGAALRPGRQRCEWVHGGVRVMTGSSVSMNVQETAMKRSENTRANIPWFAGTLHPPFSRVLLNYRRSDFQTVGIFSLCGKPVRRKTLSTVPHAFGHLPDMADAASRGRFIQ